MPTVAELLAHPLSIFLQQFELARDQLFRELIEQEGIEEDGSLDIDVRAAARATKLELTAAIGKVDESRTLFLVKVFTGITPPSQELVNRTVQLNTELAAETVKVNLAGTYLRIVADYLTAAKQILSQSVPAAPSPPAAAPAPAATE
jgi:hypothetical protein